MDRGMGSEAYRRYRAYTWLFSGGAAFSVLGIVAEILLRLGSVGMVAGGATAGAAPLRQESRRQGNAGRGYGKHG